MPAKYQSWESPRCQIMRQMAKARPMSRALCLTCKGGRLMCGMSYCPLLEKVRLQNPFEGKLKQDMFGPSPSIFVGWRNYPDVFVGPMTSVESNNASLLDDPASWYGMGFDDILLMRSMLVRSKSPVNVRNHGRFVSDNQEIALSVKPVDVETHFKRQPTYSMSFSPISQPMGPSGVLDSFKIADNPRIPANVEYVVGDEIRASDMLSLLFDKGYDVYYLTRALSSGALGMPTGKRLVPTRWSITAVDDILTKELLKSVRTYPSLSDYLVYSNQYLENHFEILLMPGAWEFEQFEAWAPETLWTMSHSMPTIIEEHERHEGRTDYAINEGGGYYAGRFGVVEALSRMMRQARVVIFREIYEGYVMPVGVWEVRENVRKAFEKRPKRFNTLREALDDISTRLKIPLCNYVEKSEILRQRRITDYS
ncbi:MAG: Nre family DNA repair protein [Candidatus Altiarchaeota archaeon]